MTNRAWIDDFIQEVKKLAYDIPPPNPYSAMLLSHCLEAERRLVEEHFETEKAGFQAFKALLNTYPSDIVQTSRSVAEMEQSYSASPTSAKIDLHDLALRIADETWLDGSLRL
jgi:hypothetical protein